MEWHLRWLVIFSVIILICMYLSYWIHTCDPQNITKWWNNQIKLECDYKDRNALFHDAWNTNIYSISQFHSMINIHHTNILEEILSIIPGEQPDTKCSYIWLRYFHDCPSNMDKLPTLSYIMSKYPNIPVLGLMLQYPGYQGKTRNGLSRAVYRYYYGLHVPYGSEDIMLQDTSIRCKEGLGWH